MKSKHNNKNNKKHKHNHRHESRRMSKAEQIDWKEDQKYVEKIKLASVKFLQRTPTRKKRELYYDVNNSWIDEELLELMRKNEFNTPHWDT